MKKTSPKKQVMPAKRVDMDKLDKAIKKATPILKRMSIEYKIEKYGLQQTGK